MQWELRRLANRTDEQQNADQPSGREAKNTRVGVRYSGAYGMMAWATKGREICGYNICALAEYSWIVALGLVVIVVAVLVYFRSRELDEEEEYGNY